MDFWMIARQDLKNDLPDIFSALDNLQYQYDWVIICKSDFSNQVKHALPMAKTPDAFYKQHSS